MKPTKTLQMSRLWTFFRKPSSEKTRSLYFLWRRAFPSIPIPIRLPFGAWWLIRNDYIGAALVYGNFENNERSFVESFLRPGMVVLDIGAHHGYYTLLASQKVGVTGTVIAFEPSPRERRWLKVHLRLNRAKNVAVEGCALGETEGAGRLFVVADTESGCNSLREPQVGEGEGTISVPVRIERLDEVLMRRKIDSVDFIKLDAEGAELSVLNGAVDLLGSSPRPVILVEVQDVRTKPWGYAAKEILQLLCNKKYRWFRPSSGTMHEIDTTLGEYDGNFLAVPEERLSFVRT